MGEDQGQNVSKVDHDRPQTSKMEGKHGEKRDSPRPCKLSVRQDLIDIGRVGSIDVTLKQRDQWPREKQQSCTSFSVIRQALRKIPSMKAPVKLHGQRKVARGSENHERSIPFELPPLIPIERIQQPKDESDAQVSQLRHPPPLIPIPLQKSAHTPSPTTVSPDPGFPNRPTFSPQTPPLDLTQASNTSRLHLQQDAREYSPACDSAQQCDTAGKTSDTEAKTESCCPLCKQQLITLASLKVHLGQCKNCPRYAWQYF